MAEGVYPTSIRSTRACWRMGVDRVGSIEGLVLGEAMPLLKRGPREILMDGAIPAFVRAIAIPLGCHPGFNSEHPIEPRVSDIQLNLCKWPSPSE